MGTTDAAIVGIAEILTADAGGLGGVELQEAAVRAAVADAGLALSDLDAVYALPPYSDAHSMFALTLVEQLGITCSTAVSVDVGGTVTPITMVLQAIAGVSSGLHDTAVCVFGEAARTGRRHAGTGWTVAATLGTEEFEEPFGAVGFVVPYALIAADYLNRYGCDRRGLAEVALSARRHSALHPLSLMGDRRMTLDDYRNATMISDPLGLLDCSVMADGAGALVITSAARARDLPQPPVSVTGAGISATHKNVNQLPELDRLGMRSAAQQAFRAGGIGPSDIDVALLHDAFTISTLITVEELGLCERGEATDYALAGNLDIGSRCPVNTHGGLLSQGHMGGILHLTEAVTQLRGQAGPRQVPDAEVAVVAGNGAIFGVCGVMVLAGAR